ncbi:calcineurin-like phosphoesterase [Aspergillus bertholletiae]|uniref:Calcineurin-like phosphoesterase n=1 Tax=Aspergillus bertholletiae TaxID=1226010 RepID=A0A5N7B9K9_9EURO|nr:calcineurin-like phosphoesterase [Aspergillus bertholletiae]
MIEKVKSLFSSTHKHPPASASASFQVLSDLHLETGPPQYASFEIPVRANHLILAGDIGRLADYDRYCNFIQKQTDRFALVFLVLGNHEFYHGSFAEGIERARMLEQEPCLNGRLVLLHQRRFDLPGSGVTVLGCTLWSDVAHDSRRIVCSKVKDRLLIRDWSVDDHNARHRSDLTWLRDEIRSIITTGNSTSTTTCVTEKQTQEQQQKKKQKQRSVLVITHHAPSTRKMSSPQQHAESALFGTDTLPEGLDGVVKTWVFGHTHYTTDFREQGVRIISNQRGYMLHRSDKTDGEGGKFDIEKVIHV